MKKIIAIGILSMFLMTSFIAAAEINNNTNTMVENKNLVNNQPRIYYTPEGDLIKSYKDTQQGETGGGPDLVFTELSAAYGYRWFYHNCNGIYTNGMIENHGKNYYSDTKLYCTVAFFADNETTAFGTIVLDNSFDPYSWEINVKLGFSWFFPREEQPETITVKIDYTNEIPESNENNNEKTIPVYSSITIEGHVNERIDGELIPVEEAFTDPYDGPGAATDNTGYYSLGVIPKEPINEPDTYSVDVYKQGIPYHGLKESDPAFPGETTTLDFIFSLPPSKPSKPSGPVIIQTNIEYTFSTSATEPEGEQIYYSWYFWDFGTDLDWDWVGPYESGETCEITHIWSKPTISRIRVVARDPGGIISEWSDTLIVIVSKNKALNSVVPLINQLTSTQQSTAMATAATTGQSTAQSIPSSQPNTQPSSSTICTIAPASTTTTVNSITRIISKSSYQLEDKTLIN